MSAEHSQDDSLLQRIACGDRDAFAELYRRRRAGVYRFALQMSGSEALAEDVVQEVFLALLDHGRRYDPARGHVASFLLGIARNHVLRALARRRWSVEAAEEPAVQEDLESDLATAEIVAAVRAAVLALPVRFREVVVLCDLEEMDYAEAAETLRCPVGTVRSRLHWARRTLAERLQSSHRGSLGIKAARCSL